MPPSHHGTAAGLEAQPDRQRNHVRRLLLARGGVHGALEDGVEPGLSEQLGLTHAKSNPAPAFKPSLVSESEEPKPSIVVLPLYTPGPASRYGRSGLALGKANIALAVAPSMRLWPSMPSRLKRV